jgi:hypothetical protein
MAATAGLSLTLDPMGKMFQNASSLKSLGQKPNWRTIQWTFTYSLALIIFVISEKKAFEHFPIGSNVNLCIAVAAILDFRIKAKLYVNVHWMVLYKLYVFCSDMKFKMAATAGLSLTIDPTMNIHVQFGFNHICSFWEEGIWTFSHRVQC